MIAIKTYFMGPTNHRGSRIAAQARPAKHGLPAIRVVLNWDHAKNSEENHRAAAQALATKMNWEGDWVEGGMDDGSSVWVCLAPFTRGYGNGFVVEPSR